MQILIDTNLTELPIWINQNVLKQAKFATSVALYETSKEISEKLKEGLSNNFTIRSGWVAKGIRVKPISSRAIRKTGAGIAGMEAKVGTVDDFMARQELGGIKKARKKSVAIPVREPKTQILNKKLWPKAVLKKPGHFLWVRPGDGRAFVLYRETKERYPIQVKYSFKKSVKIPPRWNMRETAEYLIEHNYHENFKKAFELGLATAKK